MKKVLMSVGPIPARLDAVKFLTNRFKGGLAMKTAEALSAKGHDVTLVAWKFTDLDTTLPVIRIDDVVDYVNKILAFEADAYILAGAVANLMPSNPYEGKFPSHNYKVGEKFNIEFEIAPRVIDEIKKVHPRSALVGYKLFDGEEGALIEAAKHTLFDSKANLVFANHPAWAKERKIVLTQDGAIFNCSFDEHIGLIDKLLTSRFYETVIGKSENDDILLNEKEQKVVDNYPVEKKDGRAYGTFAIRRPLGFLTTTRGKHDGEKEVAWVSGVDHVTRKIYSNKKATLNAPLLDKFLKDNPTFKIVIHGHDLIGDVIHPEYEFAGSVGDLKFAKNTKPGKPLLLTHHGYLVGFENEEQFIEFMKAHHE